jgi:hypothetical protein
VRSRTEAEPHRLYGFRLQRRGKLAAEMTKAFLDLVGNRCDVRVRLDPPLEARVLVQSERESHEFSGVADDVSLGGARLLLPAEAERLLSRVESAELRLWLPGDEQPLTLTVDVRHRSATGDGVAYGTRFDPEASPEFAEQQQRIGEFVAGLRRG